MLDEAMEMPDHDDKYWSPPLAERGRLALALAPKAAAERPHARILGQSLAMRRVLSQLRRVAPTSASVLVLGETGTGKELIAKAIHEASERGHAAFVPVNCGAIPRELFESEFFGHTKGAFTGALRDRKGRFELADGGTLFLDEIGEIPLELQAKLLRVLQEGVVQRLGEERERPVDVRIVAATNRDLRQDVRSGQFRQDLYYRLNVIPIEVPPLRDRVEDIPELAWHFIRDVSAKLKRPAPTLTPEHVSALQYHDWPGNIRELHNVLERAVILASGVELALDLEGAPSAADDGGRQAGAIGIGATGITTEKERERHMRSSIVAALVKSKGKIYGAGGAAALLGVKPTTLSSRMKALDIEKPSFAGRGSVQALS